MAAVGAQWTIDVAIQGAKGLIAVARSAQNSTTVAHFPPPAPDYSDRTVILGRVKAGRALESRRVVHVFELSPDLLHATTLTACCGGTLPVDDLQWLPRLAGMPCERCVARSLCNTQAKAAPQRILQLDHDSWLPPAVNSPGTSPGME